MTNAVVLERIREGEGDGPPCVITAYRVRRNGVLIGFVWSCRVLSYRGTQGWNRGIRIRDFHPLEWRSGVNPWERGQPARTRRDAVNHLISEVGSGVSEPAGPEERSHEDEQGYHD